MPLRLPLIVILFLTTSSAFAQDSTSTDEQSPTVTLTISEFQTEIERACAADAKQARQFRAQRELNDRLSVSLHKCNGALGLAIQNDTREQLWALEQQRRADALWYWVGVAGSAVSSFSLFYAFATCEGLSKTCLISSGVSAAAAAGVAAIWVFRW